VSPVKYELGFYIPEGDILHSDRRENHKSYIVKLFYMSNCERLASYMRASVSISGDVM
jgi:hypothetical protein